MKTSYFYSPKHPSKICDIVVETLLDYYRKQDIDFYSDIFSFIKNDTLFLEGFMDVSSPIADVEIMTEIQKEIGNDYTIINNIVTELYEGEFVEKTFSGVYLGYSCIEVDEMIPFEHKESRELVRTIYDKHQIPLKAQVHVNGEKIIVSLEHNFDDIEELETLVKNFFNSEIDDPKKLKGTPEIHHSNIRTDIVYKSNDSITSSFYGPRAWYGETDYIGSDFLSNKRLGHFIVREIANDWAKKKVLNYCAVEIDYIDNNPTPIHFGIKGNDSGIHIENGTFFEFGDIETVYPLYKQKVLDMFKTGELNIIEIAKWGFPSTDI